MTYALATLPVSSPAALDADHLWNHFRPVKNTIKPRADWNGCMFETFGDELEYVLSIDRINPRRVWTILDCDGAAVVASGFHHVNRIGYLITEIPAEEGVDYEMLDSEPDSDDEQL